MSGPRQQSLIIYAVLVVCLVAATVVFQRLGAGGLAAAFQWPIVLAVAAAGVAGVFLADRIRVPEMLDSFVSSRWRFAFPRSSAPGAAC